MMKREFVFDCCNSSQPINIITIVGSNDGLSPTIGCDSAEFHAPALNVLLKGAV
jgi:hypothetical protein